MKMNALWWWIDRWRKSSAFMDMTLEQQGAYRNLLDEATLRGGPLPDDDRVLAKACGDAKAWRRLKSVVLARFVLTADGWRNETLDTVLHQSERRAANQAHYRARRDNRADNAADNTAANKPASPDPDPISKKEKREKKSVSLSPAAPSDPLVNPEITQRAGDFIRRYQALYPEYREGARYLGHEHRDYLAAVSLCEVWPDDRLDKLAVCFLTTNHKFAEEGSRTIPQLRALASWLDGELAKWEHAHASA